MPTYSERELEALDAYRAYVEQRTRCVRGEAPWSTIAEWFTPDAVFIDPGWGRIEGHDEMADFFEWSIKGLEGWDFPEQWTTVDGDRLVSFWWNRIPGTRDDGSPLQAPAFSVLHYAGDGRFDYELDVMNIVEVTELMAATTWSPGEGFRIPEPNPDRNPTPPRLETP
jgi:ketosteroid isomerase-like protein